ncbi:hypothetical protein BDN70DRAFT_880716 [Pholiota conissans]|uniref:Uncharacterized protein n=1 Tax=Pholiota conissans TaxID=109636 RepID=A0A9P6CS67_9AGAR|nr:hypothetical protein BDN70DRAFT_880716 [Pholiota conissans]
MIHHTSFTPNTKPLGVEYLYNIPTLKYPTNELFLVLLRDSMGQHYRYKEGENSLWADEVEFIASKHTSCICQVFIVSPEPDMPWSNDNKVEIGLLLSGPGFECTESEREAIARELGANPTDIVRMYVADYDPKYDDDTSPKVEISESMRATIAKELGMDPADIEGHYAVNYEP